MEKSKIIHSLSYEKIAQKHQELVNQFSCQESEVSVEQFLKEEAMKLQEYNMAITRLCFDNSRKLIGYFTLYNDQVKRIGKDKRKKHGWKLMHEYSYYPALRLHFLGVDDKYQRKGYGTSIMMEVFKTCFEIADTSGCVFITVEALNSSVEWYENLGFITLEKSTSKYKTMVLKLDDLLQ